MDMTKLTITFRNFLKLLKNTTAHTAILPPLALAEDKRVLDKFLIPKFTLPKFKSFLIGRHAYCYFLCYFRKSFQMFSKKYFDEFIVIYWWNWEVVHKQRNISTTV